MNKRILLSVGMLVFVAAVVVGGTGAFFSDTETSAANVFTAGAVTLAITDITHTYDGDDGNAPIFNKNGVSFTLADLKPLDEGSIDYKVLNGANEAFVCARVIEGDNADNTVVNPEADLGDDAVEGELQDFLSFKFGAATGILSDISGQWQTVGTVNPNTPTNSVIDYCFGDYDGGTCVLSGNDDNLAQTDSVEADIEFYAVQTRNNEDFTCADLNDPVAPEVLVGAVLGDYTAPAPGSCDATVTDVDTIQSGIDALNGDTGTVCVEDGTYAEDITTTGVGQTIVALNAQGATIDGGARLVHDDAVLQGFVITGSTDTSGIGGNAYGVFVSGDGIEVLNNQIVGTYEAQANNQGIVTHTNVGIDGAQFINNSITGFHSGIYINPGGSNALVKWNDLFANTVGMSNDNPESNTIELNDVRNNTFEGIGLTFDVGDLVTVSQNNITDNSTDNELGNYGNDTPNAVNNWWGDVDGSDDTDHGSNPSVTFDPEAASEFGHR